MIGLERNDSRVVRWMCSVGPVDRISAEELRTRLKLNSMREYLQDMTLQWFGLLKKLKGMVDLVNVETSSLGVVTPEDVVGEHGNKNLGFWI